MSEATQANQPPQHPFELRISIGGNDWEYVLRTLDEIAAHIRQHGPECGLSSGGWNGCHSVDIQTREVTPAQYREELEAWMQAVKWDVVAVRR